MPAHPLVLFGILQPLSEDMHLQKVAQGSSEFDATLYSNNFVYWISHLNWSDKLNLVGFGLAVIGFVITFIGIISTKSQVELTKKEVNKLKEKVNLSTSIENLSSVVSQMEELYYTFSISNWDRYSSKSPSVCSKLAIISQHPNIGDKAPKINEILTNLRDIESRVTTVKHKNTPYPKKDDAQKILLEYRDELTSLLASFTFEVSRT